jgi:HD-like signal output (HDOD) protein
LVTPKPAGLLHDVGEIVIAVGLPEAFSQIAREAKASGRPRHVVEREILGTSHAEVGAYLLGVWGLPFSIVEAVAFHHVPAAVDEHRSSTSAAVHAAEALAEEIRRPDGTE